MPTALKNQITTANALHIKAKIIAEAANSPISATTDDMLKNRGVVVIPDILCNTSSMIMSYFEWIKNLSHMGMGHLERHYDQRSKERLHKHLSNITRRYHNTSVEN
jgi:glutamate dehydrogenase (NAD(P)+)